MQRYITKLKAPLDMRQEGCLRFCSTPRVGISVAALCAPCPICGSVFTQCMDDRNPSYINTPARLTFFFHSHITLSIFTSVLVLFGLTPVFLFFGPVPCSLFFTRLCLLSLLSLLCENPTKKFFSLFNKTILSSTNYTSVASQS